MKSKTKSAAIVTIHDAPKMSKRGRNAIAAWLERQASFLRQNSKQLSGRFTARYLYATCLVLMFALAAMGQTNTNVLVPGPGTVMVGRPGTNIDGAYQNTNTASIPYEGTNAPALNLPPGFDQIVKVLPVNVQAWIKQALIWVAAFSGLFALVGPWIGRWFRDYMNRKTEGPGQDEKLRKIYSNPLYQIVAYLLRIVSVDLPTPAQLDRAVVLQKEVADEAVAESKEP